MEMPTEPGSGQSGASKQRISGNPTEKAARHLFRLFFFFVTSPFLSCGPSCVGRGRARPRPAHLCWVFRGGLVPGLQRAQPGPPRLALSYPL